MRLCDRQKSLDEIGSDTRAESSQRVKRRRHRDNLIVHANDRKHRGRQPLAAFQFSGDRRSGPASAGN